MSQAKNQQSFLYIAALICFLAVGVFMFTKSDFFAVNSVQIKGLDHIAEEEVVKLLGTVKGENLFLIDTKALTQKVKLHPLVDQVSIDKNLPTTLVLDIQERMPVALVLKGDSVVEVDRQGVILKIYETWPKKDCPVLTGVEIPETIGPGQKIDNPQLARSLLLIGQASPNVLSILGEVNVSPEGQLFLYLTTGVQIRMGHGEEYTAKLKLLEELIGSDEYKSVENAIKYIDLTAGKPVLGR